MAIQTMNRRPIENKVLKVSYARNPSPEIKNANMYICGLSPDVTLEHLETLFQPFGTIITANLLKGLPSFSIVHCNVIFCEYLDSAGRSRCCGFVRMSTHSEALAAVTSLNGRPYLNRNITVKLESTTERLSRRDGDRNNYNMNRYPMRGGYGGFRQDGYNQPNGYTLFIHGIPQDNPEEWIRHYFSLYGDLIKVNVPVNEKGIKRSYGFVTYRSMESAHNAINALNGATVGSGGKTLQVSFKSERSRERRGMPMMPFPMGYSMPGQVAPMALTSMQQGYPYPVMSMGGIPTQVASAGAVAPTLPNTMYPSGMAVPGQTAFADQQLYNASRQYPQNAMYQQQAPIAQPAASQQNPQVAAAIPQAEASAAPAVHPAAATMEAAPEQAIPTAQGPME